jgi:hypothetical protein
MVVRIAATLDTELAGGRDVVFCATLGLAWRAFRRLDGEPAPALAEGAPAVARALDALAAGPPALETCVPAEASVVAAGGAEALGAAREEVRARFPGTPATMLPEALPVDGRFAFAMLDRALAFEPVFEPASVSFAGAMVKGFRAEGKDAARAGNVVVHDFVGGQSFVVELRARGEDRIVVMALVPGWMGAPAAGAPRSLGERVREALSRLERLPPAQRALAEDETFLMPSLHIDESAGFPELTGAPIPLANGGATRLDDARQSVRFRLDERGAQATSEARLASLGPPPRVLNVCGPFLVMLLRPGAEVPYLAAWIETAEAMERDAQQASPFPAGMPWKFGPPTGGGGFGGFGPPTGGGGFGGFGPPPGSG